MRQATPRRFLMCAPTYFDVTYSINPWMDPAAPTRAKEAIAQWARLRDLYLGLGHSIEYIDPVPGLPDMVFSANGATVVAGRVLLARFRHAQRADEANYYKRWFTDRGFGEVVEPAHINEGEGDLLFAGDRMLAGTGFRTDPAAHVEAQELFGLPVTTLELVDPRYYHLDTALSVLGPGEIMFYPPAFSPASRDLLRRLYPQVIIANDADAGVFGLNAVCDDLNVVLPAGASHLVHELRARGFRPHEVEVAELLKAGGGVKCCTLELR
jgi:N-dimethylarginine dimethylaminohydrolase